ncbi:cobinamide kinase [bacterium LRH843]|nr:cobinamide kinase [bacterium LRH843]
MITFITGGVRSGKSAYAEERAISLHQTRARSSLFYVATSRVYDHEMAGRVERHRLTREQSGAFWRVIEQPRNIDELFHLFKKGDVLLLDCVTILLSNEFFIFSEAKVEMWHDDAFQKEIEQKLKNLVTKFAKAPFDVIIVSNEVSYDLQTGDVGTEYYKRLLGRVHQHIVLLSKEAILVECGIPCWKKGAKECTEL